MKKKKATKNNKAFIFKVILDLNSPLMNEGKINQSILEKGKPPWREIAILDDHNLYQFANAINEMFGFMFDHCFGFYSNWEKDKRYHDSEEMYELFTDLGEDPNPRAKPVKTSKISQVFQEIGKKMLLYFDYGDGWRFIVELKDIKEVDNGKSYPILLNSYGKNPEQYPNYDDYEEEEKENYSDINFNDLSEQDLMNILEQGNLDEDEFIQLITALKAKGLKGSIMTIDDPNSKEGKTAKEYIDYHKKLPKTYPQIPKEEIAWAKKVLFSKKVSLEDKKKALIILAHTGQPDALKTLEKYEKKPDPQLKVWLNMAIQECQMFLESDIMDKPMIGIGKVTEVGRNDPCPCNSGKKYKNCCGREDEIS
jgi:hypothetical protein